MSFIQQIYIECKRAYGVDWFFPTM